MSCNGDCTCAPITSTKGDKGDTGATGPAGPTGPAGAAGSVAFKNYNVNDNAAVDIYNAGNGSTQTIIASKVVGGVVWYWGEIYVQLNDVGVVSVKQQLNGTPDATKTTQTSVPLASKAYGTIPVNGTLTVPAGQSFSLNILGPNGLGAILRGMNVTYVEA